MAITPRSVSVGEADGLAWVTGLGPDSHWGVALTGD